MPTVSVILPVYNRAATVAAAIESILLGGYDDFELIAVDDGSTDASAAVLEPFAASDARVKILRQSNAGAYAARNAGAAAAGGGYLAFQDADDRSLPGRLAKQVAFLDAHPDIALVGGGMTMIDSRDRPIRTMAVPTEPAALADALEHYNPMHTTTAMVRKSAFAAAGGFRPAFQAGGDCDLWLRIAEQHAVANLPEPLALYRVHGDQLSTKKLGTQVIGMAASRAAAKLRRAGLADPLASANTIPRELALAMGVPADQLRRDEIAAHLWWADLLVDAGQPTAAAELLDRARAMLADPTSRRSDRAKLFHGYAKADRAAGHGLRAKAAAARAKAIEKDWSLGGVARRLRRVLRPAAGGAES